MFIVLKDGQRAYYCYYNHKKTRFAHEIYKIRFLPTILNQRYKQFDFVYF